MVPAAGVEPATFRSGGERSNPLSYAGVVEEEKIAYQPQRSTKDRSRLNPRNFCHLCAFLWLTDPAVNGGDDPE